MTCTCTDIVHVRVLYFLCCCLIISLSSCILLLITHRKILDDLSSAGATLQKANVSADPLNAAAVATLQAQVIDFTLIVSVKIRFPFNLRTTVYVHIISLPEVQISVVKPINYL